MTNGIRVNGLLSKRLGLIYRGSYILFETHEGFLEIAKVVDLDRDVVYVKMKSNTTATVRVDPDNIRSLVDMQECEDIVKDLRGV